MRPFFLVTLSLSHRVSGATSEVDRLAPGSGSRYSKHDSYSNIFLTVV